MDWATFWIITIACAGSIFLFRTIPLLVLADREVPAALQKALDYVPVCAFSALVANDLISPSAFAGGLWDGLMPIAAAVPVVIVAVKTKNLALCIVVGVAAYAILMLL